MAQRLRVALIRPSKYAIDGAVDRYRKGFSSSCTLPYVRSMTPNCLDGVPLEVHTVDEHVHVDLDYLRLLDPEPGVRVLLALVGVQTHQFHRALDLAAYAIRRGAMAVIGGPHPMTCDTTGLQGRGVSFSLAEAELVWASILSDAMDGELQPVYGHGQRWQDPLVAPVIVPPSRAELRRYALPMMGIYPARGCPHACSFCSVVKIAGRRVRGQSLDTTLASLRAARDAGVRAVFITSDNFNKYPQAEELLRAMVRERFPFEIFVQCDVQVERQEELIELLARARCTQIFIGVESFNPAALAGVGKRQNRPERYERIVQLCRKHAIASHFSSIIGFPEDSAASIRQHVATLKEMGPTLASFYVLCPIPGTEQYADFLDRGLITETNLDRFDTVYPTWRHPLLSAEELTSLLYECYRSFYTVGHVLQGLRYLDGKHGNLYVRTAGAFAFAAFHRYSASRGVHPMSGGFGRHRLDGCDDYLALRRSTYGFDLAPLPQNLELPATCGAGATKM